jgi:hypothetical protein
MRGDTLAKAPKRKRVLEYIEAELKAGHTFPSMRRIADHMGWQNESSARDAVEKLCWWDGRLEKIAQPIATAPNYVLRDVATAA